MLTALRKKKTTKVASTEGCVDCDCNKLWPDLQEAHHHHRTSTGAVVACYHKSKNLLLSFEFWVGTTIGFPIEHAIWEGHVYHWIINLFSFHP